MLWNRNSSKKQHFLLLELFLFILLCSSLFLPFVFRSSSSIRKTEEQLQRLDASLCFDTLFLRLKRDFYVGEPEWKEFLLARSECLHDTSCVASWTETVTGPLLRQHEISISLQQSPEGRVFLSLSCGELHSTYSFLYKSSENPLMNDNPSHIPR